MGGGSLCKQDSSSFLKKRNKKLLLLWRALPDKSATATQKSFASLCSEKKTFLTMPSQDHAL
jgi:hypothetical protein